MATDINELIRSALEEAKGKSKGRVKIQVKIILFCFIGVYCLLVGGILLLTTFGGSYVLPLLFIGTGFSLIAIACFVRAMQWKVISGLYKKYVLLVTDNPDRSIYDFAASLNTTPDVVRDTFESFHKRGLMTDVAIDGQTNKLVYGERFISELNNDNANQKKSYEMIEVECRGCGARKIIPMGAVSTCDHCGNQISG